MPEINVNILTLARNYKLLTTGQKAGGSQVTETSGIGGSASHSLSH